MDFDVKSIFYIVVIVLQYFYYAAWDCNACKPGATTERTIRNTQSSILYSN